MSSTIHSVISYKEAVLRDAVIAKWAQRCNAQCVQDFNATIGKQLGVVAKK